MYCRPRDEPSQELLASILSSKANYSGPSDCFDIRLERAYSKGARILGLRLSEGEVGFAGGYAVFASEPKSQDWAVLRNMCVHGAPFLAQLRRNSVRHEAEAIGKAFQSRMAEVLQLAADSYWEADALGIIGKVVELRETAEAVALRALEGRTLRPPPEGTNAQTSRFYNLSLEIRTSQGSPNIASLSGQPLAEGGWHGIAKLVPPGRTAPATFRQARSLIEQLEASHDQEAELRRETELILDGLRILTSGAASREIFRQLLELLAPALEFQESVVLQRDWSNRISACAGTAPELIAADWQGAESLFRLNEVAEALELPPELAVPGERVFGSALVVKLRGGSKDMILVCLHARPGFFGVRHLGLGTRLSLIASQAFMNEEERQKVVDASKLAAIGEMAAGIVHEINQPLTAMTLAISNLKDTLETAETLDRERLTEKLTKLQGQIGRVSKIIANMRVLSRRSDGALESFDVDTAIDEALGIVQHKLTKAKISLEITGERHLKALGNPTEFSQVVLNLVTNAHDAIVTAGSKIQPDTPQARRITILTNMTETELVECLVQDTGCGFPEEHAEKAFEPFFTTKGAGQGTGLGLALCRRIIENMGGTIALGNWAGGAEIRIRLKASAG